MGDDSISTAVHKLRKRKPETGKILGKQFQGCVSNQTDKMKTRKSVGLRHLLWPDGEEVSLGSKQRKKLDRGVESSIRAANWMDDVLHKRASEIFQKRFAEFEEAGMQKVRNSV